MPMVSSLYGILVRMFFSDHAPPHFHVEYVEFKAVADIITREVGSHLTGVFAPLKDRTFFYWVFVGLIPFRRRLRQYFRFLNHKRPARVV